MCGIIIGSLFVIEIVCLELIRLGLWQVVRRFEPIGGCWRAVCSFLCLGSLFSGFVAWPCFIFEYSLCAGGCFVLTRVAAALMLWGYVFCLL